MIRIKPIGLGSLILIVLTAFGGRLAAGEIICPVCGKSFSDETQTCPNDGTDLKSLGIPLENSGAKTAPEEEDKDEDKDRDAGESTPEDSFKKSGESLKYRRLDLDGARRPTRSDAANYQDRKSRISREASAGLSEEELEQMARLERFRREDEDLRKEYEKRRALYWENRKRVDVAKLRAGRVKEAEQAHLLNSLGAPLTSLGYRVFSMAEGGDPGIVNTSEIDLNLSRYRLRAGVSTLIGVRSLSERDELVFLEHISIGFQWPWRFSPWVAIRGGVGALVSERFEENLAYLAASIGAEAGIDSWVNPWMAITPSFGYLRCMIDNAYWNSFTFKISIGF